MKFSELSTEQIKEDLRFYINSIRLNEDAIDKYFETNKHKFALPILHEILITQHLITLYEGYVNCDAEAHIKQLKNEIVNGVTYCEDDLIPSNESRSVAILMFLSQFEDSGLIQSNRYRETPYNTRKLNRNPVWSWK